LASTDALKDGSAQATSRIANDGRVLPELSINDESVTNPFGTNGTGQPDCPSTSAKGLRPLKASSQEPYLLAPLIFLGEIRFAQRIEEEMDIRCECRLLPHFSQPSAREVSCLV